MNKYAFFDLDGTLHPNGCSHDFLCILQDRKLTKYNYRDDLNKFLKDIDLGIHSYNEYVDFVLNYVVKVINELPKDLITSISREYADNVQFYPWVKDTLNFLKKNNFKIIIISAGIDFLVKDICRGLIFDECYSTEFICDKNGIFLPPNILNSTKKTDLIKHITNDKINFAIAFGDSTGDFPMLKSVEIGFLVTHNNPQLEDAAKINNWHIPRDFNQISNVISRIL